MKKEKLKEAAEAKAMLALCNNCPCPKLKGKCTECGVLKELTEYYAKYEFKTFESCTWEEIAEISRSGKASEQFNVGDEKVITLYTGEKVTLVILGFNHDSKADGSGKAGISIGLKNLIDGDFEMNLEDTNEGGWNECRMRKVYMERIFKLLPEELQKVIVPVQKATSKGDQSTDLTISTDKLFLFALAELNSATAIRNSSNNEIKRNAATYEKEGEQYAYYKELLGDADPYDDNEALIKSKADGDGSASYYWLRSPYVTNASYFRSIYYYGNVISYYAYLTYGVCFGFCV